MAAGFFTARFFAGFFAAFLGAAFFGATFFFAAFFFGAARSTGVANLSKVSSSSLIRSSLKNVGFLGTKCPRQIRFRSIERGVRDFFVEENTSSQVVINNLNVLSL